MVQKILPNGTVSFLAGNMNYTCAGEWCVNVGVGADMSTNVYAATEFKIVKIAPDGSTELDAGRAGYNYGFSDGPRLLSYFQGPEDVVFDSAMNMYVSDQLRIRKIRPDGWVSSLAGTGIPGYRNGRGSDAQFNAAFGLCVDSNQNVYVADSVNNSICKISPDTFGIGIADDWQRGHFGYVGIDPNADPDHDGMSNFAEFWSGTDPLDPISVLLINSVSIVTNGYTKITWQSVAGKSYAVKYSTDLMTWNFLGAQISGDGSLIAVVDSTPVQSTPRRFFRVFLADY